MQSWSLTAALSASALAAAIAVPSLQGVRARTRGAALAPQAVSSPAGSLHVSGTLDQHTLFIGETTERFLVFDIKADPTEAAERRPVHLSVVVDTSGSMSGAGKIDHAQMATETLANLLEPGDSFSLVSFSDQADVVVPIGPVDAKAVARQAETLVPEGGTNLYAGLESGLTQLSDASLDGVKRVVLLSDGIATVGNTHPASLTGLAGSLVSEGIAVSALGLGLDYNEDLLASMSDLGGGTYRFVNAPAQLSALFAEELRQMTSVAGREATLSVHLPDGVSLLEVYSWDHQTTPDGYQVFLGDICGAESRKVVAKVRVAAGHQESMDIGHATLAYVHPGAASALLDTTSVTASLTHDRQHVRDSLVHEAADKAAQAASAHQLRSALLAYESGNTAAQQEHLAHASATLRATGLRTGNPDLDALARDYDELLGTLGTVDHASEEGLYQVKVRKEAARVLSR